MFEFIICIKIFFLFLDLSCLKTKHSHRVSIQLTQNKTKTMVLTCRRKASRRKRRGKCILKSI